MTPTKKKNIVVNVHPPTSSIFTSWKFFALVVLVLTGIVVVFLRTAQNRVQTRRLRSQIRRNCATNGPSLLLLIHCCRTDGLGLTQQLFRQAYCPFRIRTVLYISGRSKTTVRQTIQNLARQNDIFRPFVDNIQLAQTTEHATCSTVEALREGLRSRNRDWYPTNTVVLSEFSTAPRKYWDREIWEVYTSMPPETVLSCVPPEHLRGVVSKQSYRHSRVFQNLKAYIHNSSFVDAPAVNRISRFPVLRWSRGPIVVGRLLPRVYTRPLRSTLVSSDFLFANTTQLHDALNDIPDPVLQGCRRKSRLGCTDYLLSAALHYAGLKTYSICLAVTSVTPAAEKMSTTLSLRVFQSEEVAEWLEEYGRYIGVDLSRGLCSGRARMGLLPGYTKNEILSKYRSMKEFESVKDSLRG